jgi:hypothetical protein
LGLSQTFIIFNYKQKNKMKTIIAAVAGLALIIGLVVFGANISITNKEVTLRKKVLAQQDVSKANFDKMFKVIAQTAEIPEQLMEKSKEAFKEIYTPLMEGRYGNARGGALMSWVTESNPQFDLNAIAPLYEKLQIAIEANREQFFLEQKKLIDIQREHSTYIEMYWTKTFLGQLEPVEIQIITSTYTEKAYETGKEDDISIFNKNK